MADSDDDIPGLDLEDEEAEVAASRRPAQEKAKTTEIPNFRGKVPDADKDESKGNLQINWDADDVLDSDEEYEDEEVAEGEVGEEFAKARREALREKREKRLAQEEASDGEEVMEEVDLWNFPVDKDEWDEEDVLEEWADPWGGDEKTGFDPALVDDWDEVKRQWEQGSGPPLRPYYVPYRKHYPLIPEDHPDIRTPREVVHELERYEEFLTWASYVFKDGSAYEGTVFDDLAHGKGVYTTSHDLSRYEGEWFQNAMEGHGVLEVDIPVVEPHPDSEAAKKLRAQGKLLNVDFLDDEDKEWIKMDIEDKMQTPEAVLDLKPFEDDEAWVKRFGEKPEKGHYRYSGQWKHSRMHGCGLYEVNGRQLYGQFYFGELLPLEGDCDHNQVAIHSGLAEIAAAKARMFINKPDGMVREARGPYTDPSHPYMYEEDDLWMAPGFINAFYPVPDPWKKYVEDVDAEQEMWLNSFIKSPFRIPMPAELEYQWAHNHEFILLSNRDSNVMLQHPENLDPAVEGEILLHTPTGNLINWAEDPDGNLRFFIQPFPEDGEIRPETATLLPLGFDEFMGIVDEKGNVLDESRRGLSLEERKKLEGEDRKKAKKEMLEAKIADLREKASEKIKEKETEKYIRGLERKVEDLLLEERFRAELDAVDEEAEGVSSQKNDEKSDIDGKKSQSTGFSEDEFAAEDNKSQDQEGGGDGDGDGGTGVDDDGQEDVDENDEDDKKPGSFGTVAMVPVEEQCIPADHSHGSIQQPLATVFASLSMVPQVAFKQVLESSISSAERAWSSRFGAKVNGGLTVRHNRGSSPGALTSYDEVLEQPDIVESSCALFNTASAKIFVGLDKLKGSSPRLQHSSSRSKFRAMTRPQHRCIPASECLLAALRPCSSPTIKGSWRVDKNRSYRRSPHLSMLQLQLPKSSLWVLPQVEVLSLALPIQIL